MHYLAPKTDFLESNALELSRDWWGFGGSLVTSPSWKYRIILRKQEQCHLWSGFHGDRSQSRQSSESVGLTLACRDTEHVQVCVCVCVFVCVCTEWKKLSKVTALGMICRKGQLQLISSLSLTHTHTQTQTHTHTYTFQIMILNSNWS